MAETKHIIILANSVRAGKHCVAGKELIPTKSNEKQYDVGPWIRLTDPNEPSGAVSASSTRYRTGGLAQTFDIAKITLSSPCNDPNHPEDWFFDPTQPWEFIERGDPGVLPNLADQPKTIWHDGGENKSV